MQPSTPSSPEETSRHNGRGAAPVAAPAEEPPFSWTYLPARESIAEVKLAARYDLFIGGKFVAPRAGRYRDVIDPATEETLAQAAEADAEDVATAVQAARRAHEKYWRPLAPAERGKYLFRIARRLREQARRFALVETLNNGKPIAESRDVDVPLACNHLFYHAGWADKLAYALPGQAPEPLGVAGQIVPWNFPLLMAAWKIGPALATGNTVVLKPAETTPLSALLLAELIQEADLPPGVVNIMTGGPATGAALAAHPDIDKLAFTGSTEVGKQLLRAAAGTRRRLTLELGGKSANILFEDAPLDQAIEGVVRGIYFNQGHVCCAGSRLFVQEAILPRVLEALRARLRTLRVGDPLDKNTDVGAIHSRAQLDRIRALVETGRAEGASFHQADCALPERGYWFAPAFLHDVSMSSALASQEVFGPVLQVMSFRTPEEAIEKANNTPYGLAAGVWTEKGARILKIAHGLRAGVVWANTYNQFDPAAPFGGYKESGFGREGGVHGLRAYLR